jgi:long-chain acyl-CoA synthetase
MAPFQSGIGLLAENLRLPVIPMRLDGVWKMKREHRRLAHFGEIVVHIGEPMEIVTGTSSDEIARALESRVLEL